MSRREIFIIFIAIIAALVVRIYFIPSPGYQQEIQSYKIWIQSAAVFGVHNIYDKTWCNSPPAYIYVLKGIGYIYRLFSPSYDSNTYLFQFLIKFPPILADILISLIIFFFVRKKNSFKTSILAMSAYAYNPAVIISSAYWGQMDPVTILISLMAILLLVTEKSKWAWGLLAVGLLTSIHLAVLLPIFILITWKREGLRALFSSIASSWCVFLVLLLTFLRFHQIDRMIDRVFCWIGAYPYVSAVAFNFWWLFRGGPGKWTLDTDIFLNIISYRTFGIILFGLFYLSLLRYVFYRYKDDNAIFFGSFLAGFSYFMLFTQMHERNVMPSLVFLLLAAVYDRNLKAIYSVVSITAFMNILIALCWAYPKDIPVLSAFFRSVPMDNSICWVNIAVFCYVLYVIIGRVHSKYIMYAFAVIVAMTSALCLPRPIHPVYLSDITPKIKYQQFGEMKIDNHFSGYFLSVNGFKFTKGIGTHAYSSLEYDLGGRYRYLEGLVGLDDIEIRGNKIEAWIYADNKLIFNSGAIQGWTNPIYFYVNIKGAKVVKLVISDGGDGTDGDNGDWLNIKAIP